MGRQLDHLESKIINAEGCIVPRGETGELCVRGYIVMLGYFKQEEQTAEARALPTAYLYLPEDLIPLDSQFIRFRRIQVIGPDRWLKSGDIATMDEAGNVRIVGRAKELIIRGGSNVYPAEIEHVCIEHVGI